MWARNQKELTKFSQDIIQRKNLFKNASRQFRSGLQRVRYRFLLKCHWREFEFFVADSVRFYSAGNYKSKIFIAFKIIHSAFFVWKNAWIFNFSDSGDMRCWNDDTSSVEEEKKRSFTSSLGKRKWKNGNRKMAGRIFDEVGKNFDENGKMSTYFGGWKNEI